MTSFSNSEEKSVGKEAVVPFLLEDKLKELGAKYEKVPILISTVSVSLAFFSGHLDGQRYPSGVTHIFCEKERESKMQNVTSLVCAGQGLVSICGPGWQVGHWPEPAGTFMRCLSSSLHKCCSVKLTTSILLCMACQCTRLLCEAHCMSL